MIFINQSNKTLEHQKNTSLIIHVLKEIGQMRRADLYQAVMIKQKERFGKSTTYQVIGRDVNRLMQKRFIQVISGGRRSQVVELVRRN